MRQILLICLAALFFAGCKKEQGPKVEVYMLKSFTSTYNQSTTPPHFVITNAVLEDRPLVADNEIRFYTRGKTTFTLEKDIQTTIQQYGPDKAFAVTVDKQPIYYGRFQPLHLSSVVFGVATITPVPYNNKELEIDFSTISGSSLSQQLDKRNDSRIINALKVTNRLR